MAKYISSLTVKFQFINQLVKDFELTLNNFYRPQRSCGKVIFSQASVSHSVRGGCLPQYMLGYIPRADTPPAATAADGVHPTGMRSCFFKFSGWFVDITGNFVLTFTVFGIVQFIAALILFLLPLMLRWQKHQQ